MTPGTRGFFCAAGVEISKPAAHGIDPEIAIEAEERPSRSARNPFITTITMIRVATAKRQSEQRKNRDDRNKALLPPRPQIAERDHSLERPEDHA